MTLSAACAFSAAPSIPRHSSGKERDTETGNDYFLARYYNSATGRFLSPDWSAKEDPVPYAKMDDPQTLNLYSYVRNNPLSHVDADGHCFEDACVVEAAIGAYALFAYTASPAGQQVIHNGVSATVNVLDSIGSSLGGLFHPDGSGQQPPPPPPSMPGSAPQGTPPSTSQQGAAPTAPIQFTPGVKAGADANAGGKCEYCGVQTVQGQKSQPGVTPPSNERQTDHYDPKSLGGADDASNAVNACRACNRGKSNTAPKGTKWELPRMKKPDNQ